VGGQLRISARRRTGRWSRRADMQLCFFLTRLRRWGDHGRSNCGEAHDRLAEA